MNSLSTQKIKDLEGIMLTDYVSVNKERNPFASKIDILTPQEIESFVLQYSLFPKNIISFFITGIYNLSYHGFTEVSEELIRNLGEELGKDNDGNEPHRENFLYKPHYTILREGIMSGLGIDIKKALANNATQKFLNETKSVLDSEDPNEVCGAAYALETSAVPELKIVVSLVRKLFELNQKPLPDDLEKFFMSHISEIEIGHEERLRATCSQYIMSQEDFDGFESGFRKVLTIMDDWWKGMSELNK